MVLGIFAAPATEARAAAKATVTKAVHIELDYGDDFAIEVEFAEKGDQIKNLKTSSKNIIAKVTNKYLSYQYGSKKNTANIGLFAKKEGTYTVSFDIVNADGKKVSSHSVKVYANEERAIKSVKFAGPQDFSGVTSKTKGKLSVMMNKGYKLNKIVVQTYDKDGQRKSETVKNNSTITLGKYPRIYGWKKEPCYYYNWGTSITAETDIEIFYTDKYTKSEESITYVMHRLAP